MRKLTYQKKNIYIKDEKTHLKFDLILSENFQ